jgi:hypothetical protein
MKNFGKEDAGESSLGSWMRYYFLVYLATFDKLFIWKVIKLIGKMFMYDKLDSI